MPNQQNLNFLRENKADVSFVIRKENKRRERRSMPPLNEMDIDDAVTEMREIHASGKSIRSYKFPATSDPIQPKKPATVDTSPAPRELASPRKLLKHNSFHFEVALCANGFLLNINKNGAIEPFIFKTPDELMEIFKDTLFVELERLKEKKAPKKPETPKEENLKDNGTNELKGISQPEENKNKTTAQASPTSWKDEQNREGLRGWSFNP